MTSRTSSPLRRRMVEDMTARRLGRHSQRSHIYGCERLASFLKRSPDTATADDVRRFRLRPMESGASPTLPTHGVHPPLPDPRPAQGLPPHPPRWPVRPRQPSRQPGPRSRAAPRGAPRDGLRDRGDGCRERAARRTMPPLWRPHARHRDLRPRPRAQVQAATRATTRLEGHLMMPPTKPDGRASSDHRWSATPRSKPADRQPTAPARPPLDGRGRPSTPPQPHPGRAKRPRRPCANSSPPPAPPTSTPQSPAPSSRLPHPRDFVPWPKAVIAGAPALAAVAAT
jgi:hypothetical protein